jgi:2-polyprenyl-3-methyl-5-hydroxy-6-metoxy-1,4-benzoquinol methylase
MNNHLGQRDVTLVTEQVGCGFCHSREAKRMFTERYILGRSAVELGINRCRECGLVYVSPRLTPGSTRLVYELDTEQTISDHYCWDGSASEQRFTPLLKRLARLARPGTLLDVGCGGGQFLRAAKRYGLWQVTGVEPIANAAQHAERYAGCEVRRSTLEEAGFARGSFHVITLLGVLEHLHDPAATLRLARELLQDDGVLAAYVPNFAYLRWKDAGPVAYARAGQWSMLHPQEHLFQYTNRTLGQMLQACGFEVVRVDVGRPFAARRWTKQVVKAAAYWSTCALKAVTGIHLGGLEIIARANSSPTEHRERLELDKSA